MGDKKYLRYSGEQRKEQIMYKRLLATEVTVPEFTASLTTVDVTEKIHMNRMSKAVRDRVTLGLKTGVLSAIGGLTGFIYKHVCTMYELPEIRVGTDGTVVVNALVSNDVLDSILAVAKLTATNPERKSWRGHRDAKYLNIFAKGIKAKTVRDFVGSEYRSEYRDQIRDAVDFLSNGVLTKTIKLERKL